MADSTLPTPKTEPEKVSFWLERINVAKKSLEAWTKESGADRFVDEYNGKFEIFLNGLRGKIPVPPINDVFSYVQSDVAYTYNRDPYISINPKAGSVRGAKLWEVLLNYDWRELKVKDEVEPEIIDKDLVGYGWHKVGYAPETEGTGDLLKIKNEKFYSMRVDWKDMVWNIGSKTPPKDCVWIAQRIIRPLFEVKQKYGAAAAKLEGVQCPEVDKDTYNNALYKDDIKVAVMWEVWDAESHERMLLAEGLLERFLEKPKPWPPYMDEFPFLMYWDIHAPGKTRPMSAIAPWEHQVLEKMVIMAAAVNHVKRWNRQMMVTAGAISSQALDQYERGDDGAVIENNGTGKLDENVKILDYGQLPTDFYMMIDRISAIQNNTSRMPEFLQGGVTKTSSRTIGELQEMKAGAKGAIDRRIDRFETHLENIARHMLAQRKANFDFEEVVKIVGETPEEVIKELGDLYDPITRQVSVRPEDIMGEYDVEIKAGSTLPLDKETKMKTLEIVLQALMAVPPGTTSPMLNAVVSEMLDGFDIKSLKEAWVAQEQQAQEQKQMQQEEVSADSQKATSQAEKNLASAEKIRTDSDIQMATTIADLVGVNGKEKDNRVPGL
jgi:hypothetical protein